MGDIGSTVLLFAVMGGALYFLMIRPQQKRQKEQQNLMNSLEPGVRVMLISGIFATIKYVGDKQAVVEIAPGVEMTVDKRAISPQAVVDEFEYEDESAEPAGFVAAGSASATDADEAVVVESDEAAPAAEVEESTETVLEETVDAAAPDVAESDATAADAGETDDSGEDNAKKN